MPPHLSWPVIALRLALTVVAGAVLGLDRSRHEHPAGLRTTLLVTLAASIAMIQTNLLLPTNGRAPDSFSVMDLMRLPLGILTGVGFIGAGAILKRGDAVTGVTTAATLWFATVVGLCLGGGQIALGAVSTVAGGLVLRGLKPIERRLHRNRRATLIVKAQRGVWSEAELRALLASGGIDVHTLAVATFAAAEPMQCFDIAVRWRPSEAEDQRSPTLLREIEQRPGLVELLWKPVGALSEE
jgi:putative Mg2+ transporter-C (MgtC) family protein